MAKQNKVAASQGKLALEPSFFHFTYMAHQKPAVNAAVALFNDIPIKPGCLEISHKTTGNANPNVADLEIYTEIMKRNLQSIQTQNCIERDSGINFHPFPEFDIEMETGTGKTYVYVRTIYELRRTYNLRKFVITVPSKAIFASVKQQLSDMRYHFEKEEFPEISAAQHVIYEDGDASQLTQFANAEFGILLITIQSFNKFNSKKNEDNSIVYQKNREDSPNGLPLIHLISEMHPVVIIDEPQKGFGTPISKEAIRKLSPFCVFNYSATHREHHHLIFKLGPVDSCNQKLVKSLTVTGFGNDNEDENIPLQFTPYLMLTKCELTNTGSEKIEIEYIDCNKNKAERRRLSNSQTKDSRIREFFSGLLDLSEISGNDAYIGWRFDPRGTVYSSDDHHVTINGIKYYLNESFGDIDDDALKYQQIETTIRKHLERERSLIVNRQNIGKSRYKILSLFFIDHVPNYATSKTEREGKYAKLFRKAYAKIIQEFPDVEDYWNKVLHNEKNILEFNDPNIIDRFHNGYFAIANNKYKDTTESTDSETGAQTKLSKADQEAIKSIISDKKKLLNLDYPLRFIFSHSALQEGWDNPNVFQICTLMVNHSDIAKRQRLGRGMRIPVDEFGNRNCIESNGRPCGQLKDKFEYDETINRLHVIANYSFKKFTEALQKDYANDGVVFGEFTATMIEQIAICDEDENITIRISPDAAKIILDSLKNKGYIKPMEYIRTIDGRRIQETTTIVTEKLKTDLEHKPEDIPIPIPDDLSPELQTQFRNKIIHSLTESSSKVVIHKDTEMITNKVLKDGETGKTKQKYFDDLFELIKYKSTYDYAFSTKEFINRCVKRLKQAKETSLKPETIRVVTGTMEITSGGIVSNEIETGIIKNAYYRKTNELPDVIDRLLEDTSMLITRRTIIEIINQSDTLYKYFEMSDRYIKIVRKIIKEELVKAKLGGNIKYRPSGELFNKSIFDVKSESYPKLDGKDIETDAQNIIDINGSPKETKSYYKYIRCDSIRNEQRILDELERLPSVKMYIKMPSNFSIPTPEGNYIPDWGIVKEVNGEDRLYFIFESKTASEDDILSDLSLDTVHSLGDQSQLHKIKCAIAHFKSVAPSVTYFPGNIDDLLKHMTKLNKNTQ